MNEQIKLISLKELPFVMEIINDAKKLLGKSSLQWQQGYPNEETMTNDIKNSYLYGYYINEYLIGVVALVPGAEINYFEIEDGDWIKYPTSSDLNIHRIAIREGYHNKKIGEVLLKFAIDYAKINKHSSIKLDTHKVNIAMQKIAINTGFSYRGIIYLKRDEVDNLRLAYELIIE